MTENITRTWRPHDHCSDYQVCRDCGLRLGAGITTSYDATYYADGYDPEVCPNCGGPMGVDHPIRVVSRPLNVGGREVLGEA
jgi:hypothetical protein